MKPCIKGFTLVEIMIVVAIIGLLVGIALPNYVWARDVAQTRACIANMRNITSAIQQAMIEEPTAASAWTSSAMIDERYLRNPTLIHCPRVSATVPYPVVPNNSNDNVSCTLGPSPGDGTAPMHTLAQ